MFSRRRRAVPGAAFPGGGFFGPFLTDQKRVVKKKVVKIEQYNTTMLESGIPYSCFSVLGRNH